MADPRLLLASAIVLTALAFTPSAAHLFELPHKIGMAREDYFTVQAIYRGWALFGIVWAAALLANLAVAITLRGQGAAPWLALAAALIVGCVFVIFFVWTFPANQATANWTVVPEGWTTLRKQWEYSHAVNALLLFLALCATTAAAVLAAPSRPVRPSQTPAPQSPGGTGARSDRHG